MNIGVDVEQISRGSRYRHHPDAEPLTTDRRSGHHLLHRLERRPAKPPPKVAESSAGSAISTKEQSPP